MSKRVCLVSPPSRSINHYRPPVALLYLAGYLEKNGVEADIVDIVLENQIRDRQFSLNLKQNLKKIERQILEQISQLNPDLVGITCYTPEYFEVKDLAQKIKKINPGIRIVVGGIHPTFYPKDFIYPGSPFDFAVLGEGEEALLELVKKLSLPTRWSEIKSLAFYSPNRKKMVLTPKRPLVENLDTISFPAYHLINMEYYTQANPYAIRGVYTRSAYVLASRGCPSACTFCVAKKIREFCGYQAYARLRSPKHLFQEVADLKKNYQIDSFYFIDDLFTINKKQVAEFCRLLKKSRLGLIWGCSSKVTTVDYSTLKEMKEAGCVQIDFGVERGSNEALRQIKKGITIEIVTKVFADCQKLGIRTFANMLVNLPQETDQDLADILALLQKIQPTVVSLNIFTPYPGTEIFETYPTGITQADYPNLMKSPIDLINHEPRKYRFSQSKINLGKWVMENNKKYNRIYPHLKFHLSYRYLKNIFRSQRKANYFKMAWLLAREFINQKF